MDEESLARLVRGAAAGVDVGPAPVEEIRSGGRRRQRWQRGGSVLAAALLVAGTVTAVGLVARDGTSTPPAASGACPSSYSPHLLPPWARSGFSDPEPQIPYVLGDDGSIAAILWAPQLDAGDAPDARNKILWVAKEPWEGPLDLVIDARLDGTGPVVERTVPGGPGPSGVDLPTPGCWQLDLTWGTHHDSMWLRWS